MLPVYEMRNSSVTSEAELICDLRVNRGFVECKGEIAPGRTIQFHNGFGYDILYPK